MQNMQICKICKIFRICRICRINAEYKGSPFKHVTLTRLLPVLLSPQLGKQLISYQVLRLDQGTF